MERLDVEVQDVKAGHFKTDDIGGRMQALMGEASLAQHSLANEQPLGTACLVSTDVERAGILAFLGTACEMLPFS